MERPGSVSETIKNARTEVKGTKLIGDPEDFVNPFVLPADHQVFSIRERDRLERAEQIKDQQGKKIWEKQTQACQLNKTTRFPCKSKKDIVQEEPTAQDLISQTATKIDRSRRQKENMTDFIGKKREMFLVQMALDTKREEIRKLEDKALLKEDALRKNELMLEADAKSFDSFLKDNDGKAHNAIKLAEQKSKLKLEKSAEIKKLSQQIQIIQSDISKLKEQMEDCEKYREFLMELTPPDYFDKQKAAIIAECKEKEIKQYEREFQEWELNKKFLEEEYERVLEEKSKKRKRGELDPPPPEIPPQPVLDLEKIERKEIDIETIPLYFQDPNQLLEIFSDLEQKNLFLIQNGQQTEHILEELKKTYKETKVQLTSKTTSLEANISELQRLINKEQQKSEEMRLRILGRESDKDHQLVLGQLSTKVADVYKACGFDASTSPHTLTMLAELEAKLEHYLQALDQMDPDYVEQSEKRKEKERRERVRKERNDIQQKLYNDRQQKAKERAQMPIQKKVGRPAMFRSNPNETKRKRKQEDNNDEEKLNEIRYFT